MEINNSLEKSVESVISEKTLRVATDASSEEKTLNLKYLVGDSEFPAFPWGSLLGVLLFVGVSAFLVWLGYQYQSKEIVVIHTVVEGDTLRSLALYYYQDPSIWSKIFLANRKQLQQDKKLIVGQRLEILFTPAQLARFQKSKKP